MTRRMVSAERPEDESGAQYHIQCRKGDVAKYVLLPGDPGRVPIISSKWDSFKVVAQHREYVTHTGTYKGVPISCTSTGIGGPSSAIALEELLRVGADTFIRVGSSGALQSHIGVGDVIITAGAVRMEGTSLQYVWQGYPALANYEVLQALVEGAESLGVKYHVGVTASTDSFYLGQGRPGFKGYMTHQASHLLDDAKAAGILNFEMEAATILTLASLYGARAGVVCAVLASRERDEFVAGAGVEDAVRVGNEAVRILSSWDAEKAKKGRRYFFPSLLE